MTKRRQILIAGMGTSPAVLTNVVWALAHQDEPVVPDEVVVFITKNGKELLRRELFENGVCREMMSDLRREKIGIDGRLVFGETSIRVIPDSYGNEIDDLRTGISASGFANAETLVPLQSRPVTFPLSHIHWLNRETDGQM